VSDDVKCANHRCQAQEDGYCTVSDAGCEDRVIERPKPMVGKENQVTCVDCGKPCRETADRCLGCAQRRYDDARRSAPTKDNDRPTHGLLNALGAEILAVNAANGWNVTTPACWKDTYKVPAVLALIHSEVSEALEAFRKDDAANFREEMADTLIRVLDLSMGLGIDMDAEVSAKLAKNRTRGYRHGGNRV